MTTSFRIGILGAGYGSRLRASAEAKPLARIGGRSLLEILLQRFFTAGATEILCALRDELLRPESKAALPQAPGLQYLFVNTDSSLHTLAELVRAAEPQQGPMLFCMADTVMRQEDFSRFFAFCQSLQPQECALLVTEFVDDEKPLWVQVDENGLVTKFASDKGQFVTSGMYFLPPMAMELALQLVQEGTHKMRNFLGQLAERNFPIKTFVVPKTIDVDHPSDLEKAADFLQRD